MRNALPRSASPHRVTGVLLLAAFAWAGACTASDPVSHAGRSADAPAADPTRAAETLAPHILWIVTDDQRADSIACFNRATTGWSHSPLGVVESPHVDALAAEGTLFTQAFCQSPGCAPSRASMHFGQYPHKTGVYGFTPHHPNAPHLNPQFPVLLERAGYQTVHVGKLGVRSLGWDGNVMRWQDASHYQTDFDFRTDFDDAGLSEWDRRSRTVDGKSVMQEVFRFPDGRTHVSNRDPKATPDEHAAELERETAIDAELDLIRKRKLDGEQSQTILAGVSPLPGDQMREARYVQAALRHLGHTGQDYKTAWGTDQAGPAPEKPVFLHVGFNFPHTPVIPPADVRTRFHGYTYKVPAFDPALFDTLPPQLVHTIKACASYHYTPEEHQQIIRDYYAYCAYGDRVIGELISGFKTHAESTGRPWLILYACGDHGWSLNEHGKSAKFSPWTLSTQTPVIVAASDKNAFPAGAVVDTLVELVDFAPTALAAAGQDLGDPAYAHLDGRDLARVARGEATRTHVMGEIDAISGHRGYLRTPRFSFSQRTCPGGVLGDKAGQDMRWVVNAPRDHAELALYDLVHDPDELNNLANDPAYVPLADWFRERTQEQLITHGRVETVWRDGLQGRTTTIPAVPGANRVALVPPAELVPATPH